MRTDGRGAAVSRGGSRRADAEITDRGAPLPLAPRLRGVGGRATRPIGDYADAAACLPDARRTRTTDRERMARRLPLLV